MDTQKHGNSTRYWTERINEKEGTRAVTVTAEITFVVEGGREVDPQLVVAGGNVATTGMVTLDDVMAATVATYECLPDDAVDVKYTTDTLSAPATPRLEAADVPEARTRAEEYAAHHPTQFV